MGRDLRGGWEWGVRSGEEEEGEIGMGWDKRYFVGATGIFVFDFLEIFFKYLGGQRKGRMMGIEWR